MTALKHNACKCIEIAADSFWGLSTPKQQVCLHLTSNNTLVLTN